MSHVHALDSWPADKIKTLLQRMRTEIPEKDTLKYSDRIANINWNKVFCHPIHIFSVQIV